MCVRVCVFFFSFGRNTARVIKILNGARRAIVRVCGVRVYRPSRYRSEMQKYARNRACARILSEYAYGPSARGPATNIAENVFTRD